MSALLDSNRLQELERVIEQGRQTFVDVGLALLEIRDSRLYRETHETFEAYCRERWRWSRVHAHRVIEAAEVTGMLPTGNTPSSEWQARELVPLKDRPHVLQNVWESVVERADRDETPITAPIIRSAVRDYIRAEAAASERELQEATANWSPELKAAWAPEVMRQQGELMRLTRDIAALPPPDVFAEKHGHALSERAISDIERAADWLAAFLTNIHARRDS